MGTTRSILKTYFETGDRPTELQFAELIDAYIHTSEANALTADFEIANAAGVSFNLNQSDASFSQSTADGFFLGIDRNFEVEPAVFEEVLFFGHAINDAKSGVIIQPDVDNVGFDTLFLSTQDTDIGRFSFMSLGIEGTYLQQGNVTTGALNALAMNDSGFSYNNNAPLTSDNVFTIGTPLTGASLYLTADAQFKQSDTTEGRFSGEIGIANADATFFNFLGTKVKGAGAYFDSTLGDYSAFNALVDEDLFGVGAGVGEPCPIIGTSSDIGGGDISLSAMKFGTDGMESHFGTWGQEEIIFAARPSTDGFSFRGAYEVADANVGTLFAIKTKDNQDAVRVVNEGSLNLGFATGKIGFFGTNPTTQQTVPALTGNSNAQLNTYILNLHAALTAYGIII